MGETKPKQGLSSQATHKATKLNSIFAAMPEMVMQTDPSGHQMIMMMWNST